MEKTTLRRFYLNQGGYDSAGAYWGHGAPLYWFSLPSGESGTLRAMSREKAKEHVVKHYGATEFYR